MNFKFRINFILWVLVPAGFMDTYGLFRINFIVLFARILPLYIVNLSEFVERYTIYVFSMLNMWLDLIYYINLNE